MDNGFGLALSFTPAICQQCGASGPPGICSECGGTRPDNWRTDPLAQMRARALAGLDRRAEALAARLTGVGQGHIPCTVPQFIQVVVDAGVFDRAADVMSFTDRLEKLDLSDSTVVGGDVRRCIVELLDHLQGIVDTVEDLAWFVPPPSCSEIREALVHIGQWGADLAAAVIQALVSPYEQVTALASDFQRYMDSPVDEERFEELLRGLGIPRDTLDERISIALGHQGSYTNEHGALDAARVFAVAQGSDSPLTELGDVCTQYLAHLLVDRDRVVPLGAVLAFPASVLASLDRPLIGHQAARWLIESLRASFARDRQGTLALVRRTIDDGPRLLAAMARAETHQRRLVLDSASTDMDAFVDIVSMYSCAAEAGFRTYASLALDLEDTAAGGAAAAVTHATLPMLGQIESRLAGSDSKLACSLRRALNRELRNARNHEDLIVSSDGASVQVGGAPLPSDRVEEVLATLTACVAGMDAALVCWGLENDVLCDASPDVASAGVAWVRKTVARALLYAVGAELIEVDGVEDGALAVSLTRPVSRAGLMAPLVGISELYPDERQLAICSARGEVLVSVECSAFRACRDADASVQDLALLHPLLGAVVRGGTSREEAAQDALATMICMLSVDSAGIESDAGGSAVLRALPHRLAYVQEFVHVHLAGCVVATQLESPLRRAFAAARAAKHGDRGAIRRLSLALEPAATWSATRDVQFGGFFVPMTPDAQSGE